MKAVINHGHGPLNDGGYDPGAISPDGYQEATETREVGSKVVQKLQANGWEILAIQDGDLADITNQSNKYNPDYFLSIHANSYADPSAHGVETYALAPGGMGEKIAQEIQKELVAATGLTDRGVKFANYWVLRKTIGYPAVLTEIGFISNLAEEALMERDTWDDMVASAICRGFSRAVGVPYTEGKGIETVKKVVVFFTSGDYSAALAVSSKLSGVAMFCRNGAAAVHPDAMAAGQVFNIGGPKLGHANEVYMSGSGALETMGEVVTNYKGGKF